MIDGNTFEKDGEIIRLWGIDAPELDQTCLRGDEDITLGEIAANALRRYLVGGVTS